MSFKLINPDGRIHDFAHKMSWGHNIEEVDRPIIIDFAEMQTHQYSWYVFHYNRIKVGDFITRNMKSGSVGLYEVVKLLPPKHRASNNDLYYVLVNFCGYVDRKTMKMQIYRGYGIKKSITNKISKYLSTLFKIRGGF